MLEAARLARQYVDGIARADFLTDTEKQDAVIRRLELLGEAAGRVSGEFHETLPDIPWRTLVGMRNILIHDYGNVDTAIVWETVQLNLPPLIDQLEAALN
jgi:uncharacterized protein with HEPN domain